MKNYNLNWSDYFVLDNSSPSGLSIILEDNTIKPVGVKQFKKNGKAHGWRLKFIEDLYYIHRVIWVMKNGHIDQVLVVDHLDGNPFNNSIDNLGLKTRTNNNRNKSKQINNISGITGVALVETNKDSWYYVAKWNESNGAEKSKYFSIKKLGEEYAKLLAIEYRKEQILRLVNEGLDYTNRHGI